MSRTAGQSTSLPFNSFKVVWFPPDRPVEGNTIYIRSVTDCEPLPTPAAVTSEDADG
jgi:hypothetical protein